MPTWYDAEVEKPVDEVWSSLTDVDGVLAALPGAALAREGDAASGSLKCKLGSTQITYRLDARAEVGEAGFHTAILTITGKEARGSGTIDANLTVAVRSESATSRLEVSGDIAATGRGENADDKAWRRVIGQLVNAVVPPAAPPPKPPAAPPPRPPLTVAPPPPLAPPKRPIPKQPIAYGIVAVVVLLLLRRLRRKGRG